MSSKLKETNLNLKKFITKIQIIESNIAAKILPKWGVVTEGHMKRGKEYERVMGWGDKWIIKERTFYER